MKKNFFAVLLPAILFSFCLNAQDVDSRVYKHYSKEEVSEMNSEKIEKMNFLIRESFIIPEEMKGKINPDELDVLGYAVLRLEDERAKVHLMIDEEIADGPYFFLISYKELDAAYLRIEQSFKK
ncbi:MAG: hypothetical protein JXR58_02375 [Bacteroidales bacterium]|nr:hypothetical protein [Bacteroidales bacterium]